MCTLGSWIFFTDEILPFSEAADLLQAAQSFFRGS